VTDEWKRTAVLECGRSFRVERLEVVVVVTTVDFPSTLA
jgi:hypothetical protein